MTIEAKTIEQLARSYNVSKRILKEVEMGILNKSFSEIDSLYTSVSHLEMTAKSLDAQSRFIIEKEVLEDRFGTTWYTDYFSQATYYRLRAKAYQAYIQDLNK